MVNRFLQLFKSLIGKNLTEKVRPLGHGIKSFLAALYYQFPSRKLTIIGITGTKGKTSTTIYLGRLLNRSGFKAGYISTALLFDGQDTERGGDSQPFEVSNTHKMTSLDGITLQKNLRKMVQHGCQYAVIELSSQGLAQHRHWGLGTIDIGLFLNIYPEHLEAHGGWDKYLQAKSKLFQNIAQDGIFLANADDPHSEYMWRAIPHKAKVTKSLVSKGIDFKIKKQVKGINYHLFYEKQALPVDFNAQFEAVNMFFALKTVSLIKRRPLSQKELSLPPYIIHIPGRMQWIVKNQVILNDPTFKINKKIKHIDVLVDYAHEPESMKQLLETLASWKKSSVYTQIIHILSCDGAGRDDWKKPVMGDISYANADFVVLTTDNYAAHDDPHQILALLGSHFPAAAEGSRYQKVVNRREAFTTAINYGVTLSGKVLIVSTGVGSEFGLTQPDGIIPWNESEVWQNIIKGYAPAKRDVTTKRYRGRTKTPRTQSRVHSTDPNLQDI